jgi:hypothetical protein
MIAAPLLPGRWMTRAASPSRAEKTVTPSGESFMRHGMQASNQVLMHVRDANT